jgi:gluconolactonase
LTTFAADLAFPEAPVLLPDGSWLVSELDASRGHVTAVSRDGRTRRTVARTGRPNGLCLDRDTIWVAESLEPALLRLTLAGTFEPVLNQIDDLPLLWPNDLCLGPDGRIYATDSGVRLHELVTEDVVRKDFRSLEYKGTVFCFDPQTRSAAILDSDLQFPNGIAFGPDNHLYVSESLTGNVYRYRPRGGGVDERELFGNVIEASGNTDGFYGPDGMCFSADGRLWVAVFGQGHVAILGGEGQIVDRMRLAGRYPTNVAFGEAGTCRLYVVETELGRMEAHDVGVDGLRLHG